MNELADRECVPCRSRADRVDIERLQELSAHVPAWRCVGDHHLERRFELPDFRSALELVVAIGALAEDTGHHPDLYLSWGKVGVQVWSHSAGGLCEVDFVLAAKIDRLVRARRLSSSTPESAPRRAEPSSRAAAR
ncbi:MAG: 4a-hydroxytetrahydrobiopterin dehydratase [Planctomycetota bacterium]